MFFLSLRIFVKKYLVYLFLFNKVLKHIQSECEEVVYFDTRGQNGVSRTASMKLQHVPAAEVETYYYYRGLLIFGLFEKIDLDFFSMLQGFEHLNLFK